MNTTAQALVFAIISVAAAAAVGMGLAGRTAQPATEIVKLERVVIVGKRVDAQAPVVVAQLPRVIIEGRRAVQADDLQIANARQVIKAI
jgi:membrane protein implicated in regulation of membrane protease activity